MAAIVVIVDNGNNGIDLMAPMVVLLTVVAVDGSGNNGVFTTSYYDNDRHPRPHCPRPRPLLDKDQRQGGGRAVMCLIGHCHGCPHWCHLCLYSQDDGAKDDGHGDRRGRNPNIHGREEVGHHFPAVWSTKNKNINKNKNKNKINNSGGNVTASTPTDSFTVLPPLLPLCK
jgi:hypothetical protein